MSMNSLQAALNKQAEASAPEEETSQAEQQEKPKAKKAKFKSEIEREKKVLIGGHFSKQVAKQLRFIAVEEEVTNQQLLSEALDLLFIKKGKSKIKDL